MVILILFQHMKLEYSLFDTVKTVQLPVDDVFHKPYMISVVYNEQFTNAFIHYNEFVSLSSRWNFTAVEPFVLNSRIYGFQQEQTTKISHLLDMKQFQQRYADCLGPQYSNLTLIDPMDSFLKESFRKIVVIYFSGHTYSLPNNIHKNMDKELKELFKKNKSKQIVNCMEQARSANLKHSIEELLQKELKSKDYNVQNFSITNVFCVQKITISLTDLMDFVANLTQHKASVLFVSWQGKFTRHFSDFKTMDHCILPFTKIPFSSNVSSSAAEFVRSKGFQPNEYISVHIRFEKLFEFAFKNRKSNPINFYECCMNRTRLVLEGISNKTRIPLSRTLLVHDMGEHGSDSCHYEGRWNDHKICQVMAKQVLPLLKVPASEYKANDVTNTGFISLVEEASLFNGRLLLTVGQGSFQKALIKRYKDYHSNKNISSSAQDLHYHVCLGTEIFNGISVNHPSC